jgi:hypothetical protein
VQEVQRARQLHGDLQSLPRLWSLLEDDIQMSRTPNHALQRTAPHVTAAASDLRLSPTVQPPCRAPRSLSLGVIPPEDGHPAVAASAVIATVLAACGTLRRAVTSERKA